MVITTAAMVITTAAMDTIVTTPATDTETAAGVETTIANLVTTTTTTTITTTTTTIMTTMPTPATATIEAPSPGRQPKLPPHHCINKKPTRITCHLHRTTFDEDVQWMWTYLFGKCSNVCCLCLGESRMFPISSKNGHVSPLQRVHFLTRDCFSKRMRFFHLQRAPLAMSWPVLQSTPCRTKTIRNPCEHAAETK